MKRLLIVIISVVSAVMLSVTAFAQQDENLMLAYDKVNWQGDTVYYERDYGTLSFRGESGTASVTFPVGDSLGVWFYFDMGNLSGKGSGNGSLEFLDSDGKLIKAYETDKSIGSGSFHRYELGSDEGYVQIPENSASVRVTISYYGGKQSPYFRNFYLGMSKTHTIDTSITEWDVSGKLEIVQVGVTRTEHLIWIFFVAMVAVVMLVARKLTDKAKKIG